MSKLLWLCALCFVFSIYGGFSAHAQTANHGSRFFPPDSCVNGVDNVIVWRGDGTDTRCVQLPVCNGDDAKLQYDGAQFTCVSGHNACPGPDCPDINNNCPAQDAGWQVDSSVCHASLPFGTNGQIVTVHSNNPLDFAGTAQYRCVAPGRMCPPGALCPDILPHWELLDGATCQPGKSSGGPCPLSPTPSSCPAGEHLATTLVNGCSVTRCEADVSSGGGPCPLSPTPSSCPAGEHLATTLVNGCSVTRCEADVSSGTASSQTVGPGVSVTLP